MTRQEFLDSTRTWEALQEFWVANSCPIFDEIKFIKDDELLDRIVSDLKTEMKKGASWYDIRYKLAYIEDSDFYQDKGILRYISMDDADFDQHKDLVLEWAEDNGVFASSGGEEEAVFTDSNKATSNQEVYVCRLFKPIRKLFDKVIRPLSDSSNNSECDSFMLR